MSEMNAQTVAEITEKLRVASENTTRMYDVGFEAGRVLGDDVFWDSIQAYGNRTNYERGFANTKWDKPFNPKYSFKNATKAQYMFSSVKAGDNMYTDKLDFSKCASMVAVFLDSDVTRLKVIDMRSCLASYNGMASSFYGCTHLREITEFYPSVNTIFSATFSSCTALETINFCSEIAVNGLDLKASKILSKDSIKSIMGALSSSTSGLTVTLSKEAVNKAFETSEGANDGENSTAWADDIIDAHSNWNIVLA